MVRITRLALAIVSLAATASCSRNPRMAIIYGSSADAGMVTNGTAFDRATIDMGECRWIMVPSKTEVEFAEEPGRLTLMMKKEMSIMGHPPKRITIDEVRQKIGCAYRKHDGKILVGKFGEFDSGGEGGEFVSLKVRVPRGTVIERNDDLELPSCSGARTSPRSSSRGQGFVVLGRGLQRTLDARHRRARQGGIRPHGRLARIACGR